MGIQDKYPRRYNLSRNCAVCVSGPCGILGIVLCAIIVSHVIYDVFILAVSASCRLFWTGFTAVLHKSA